MAMGLTYKKNSFFIETSSGSLFQDEIFAGSRIGHLLSSAGLFSKEEDLKEQILLNHELNHIVQDLSINSSIVEGDFRDTIKGYISTVSRIEGLRFPLCDANNRLWNLQLQLANNNDKENLQTLYFLYDIYDMIFLNAYVKPDIPEYKIQSQNESFFNYYNLTVTDLLETYAHHKSYWEEYLTTPMTVDKVAVLHRLTEEIHLYPYHKTDIGFEIPKKFLKLAKQYHIVHAMLMVISRLDTMELANYYENTIPKNYTSSVAYIMMRLTISSLETSLCIPSLDYIVQSVSKNPETILSFSPVHRFYRILKNIFETDYLPDIKDGEDYFITFHNWIAKQNGWLDYETTMSTVFKSLYERAIKGKEVIPNYQMTALSYKFEHLTKSTYEYPLEIIRYVNMPIMIRTSDKLVSLFFLGNHIYNDTGLLKFINLYFDPVNLDGSKGIVKYQSISNELPFEENLKFLMNNALGAKREIIIRLLASESLRATTRIGKFSCPLREGLCPHGCETCSSFKSFREIVPHCNRNILRGATEKLLLDNNTGNSIDCMLFDYLLDYGFDPLVFER